MTPTPALPIRRESAPSLQTVLLRLGLYYRAVVQKLWLILLVGMLLALVQLFQKKSAKPSYSSALTFTLNENDGGSSLGGLNSILGSFGLGGGTQPNLLKITEMAGSRFIMYKTLLSKAEINGVNDYLANHVIRIYEKHKEWAGGDLKGFLFTRSNLDSFTLQENKAIIDLANGVSLAYSFKINESGIMVIGFTSISEALTYHMLMEHFKRLSEFYINQSTERQRQTYELIKMRVDSLAGILNYREGTMGSFLDSNRKTTKPSTTIRVGRMQTDYTATAEAYGQAMLNMELSRMALDSRTPYVQAVDLPMLPLEVVLVPRTLAVLIGYVLAGFCVAVFIIGRLFLRQVMTNTQDTPEQVLQST